jgi:hypothetical protein
MLVSIGSGAPSVGRNVFPPMNALIATGSVPKKKNGIVVGVSNAAIPDSFSWHKPTDVKTRVKGLDWYVLEPPNQGKCGSCWAFASTGVMGDRARIQSNTMIPPLSVTYVLGCGAIRARESGGGPCGGGQPIDTAVLASVHGIPGWMQYKYSEETVMTFDQIPGVGNCLESGSFIDVSVTRDKIETKRQTLDELLQSADITNSKNSLDQHYQGPDGQSDPANNYANSGVPVAFMGALADVDNDLRIKSDLTSTHLLQDYGAVTEAISERGPVVGMYFVPFDFVTGWSQGHRAWASTGGVYCHTVTKSLYPQDRNAMSGVTPTARFTGDKTSALDSNVSQCRSESQMCMGGHAVAIVGYSLVDLWTQHRIKPSVSSPYARFGTLSPVYHVRNSWGATGPLTDGIAGVFQMLASGEYEVNGESIFLNDQVGFDVPVGCNGTTRVSLNGHEETMRFGGIIELSVVSQKSKFAHLQKRANSCGCDIVVGAATRDTCTPPMTPLGWTFFITTILMLIIVSMIAFRKR